MGTLAIVSRCLFQRVPGGNNDRYVTLFICQALEMLQWIGKCWALTLRGGVPDPHMNKNITILFHFQLFPWHSMIVFHSSNLLSVMWNWFSVGLLLSTLKCATQSIVDHGSLWILIWTWLLIFFSFCNYLCLLLTAQSNCTVILQLYVNIDNVCLCSTVKIVPNN